MQQQDILSFGLHHDNVSRVDEENSPLCFDRNPGRRPRRNRPCGRLWPRQFFTRGLYLQIAVIQKTSITSFVTAPLPEVHRHLHSRRLASTSSSSRFLSDF